MFEARLPHEAIRITIGRMLQCAFGHYVKQECDYRIVLLFKRAGVLSDVEFPQLPPDLVDVLEDEGHCGRIPCKPGPLILTQGAEGAESGSVIAVADLLCAPEHRVRRAAHQHFLRYCGSDSCYLTQHTGALLDEYKEDMESEVLQRWVPAGMRVMQQVEADVKVNLRGLEVAAGVGNGGLAKYYLGQLLEPSLDALLQIQDDGYSLIKDAKGMAAELEECSRGSATLFEALEGWDKVLGHLSLSAEYSCVTVASNWKVNHCSRVCWEELARWAESRACPVRRLQALSVAIANLDDILPEAHGAVREVFLRLMGIGDKKEGEPWCGLLAIESGLAKCYFCRLESGVVGLDVVRCLTLAWWLARNVTECIANHVLRGDSELIRVFRESTVTPLVTNAKIMWTMAHPRSGDASARYATLFSANPRLLAFWIDLKEAIGGLTRLGMREDETRAVASDLMHEQLQWFPVAQPAGKGVWAFDNALFPSCREWCSSVGRGEQPEMRVVLETLESIYASLSDVSNLEKLWELEGPMAIVFSRLFRALAYQAPDLSEALRTMVWRKDWQCGVFEKLPIEAITAIGDGIMELANGVQDARRFELPYVFAEQALRKDLERDRKVACFNFTVIAAAGVARVSAVRRVVRESRQEFAEQIAWWREQLGRMLPAAPPILAGNLRDVLSSLSQP